MAAGSLTLPIPFPDPTLRLYTHQTLKMSRLQLDVPPLSCIWIRSRASVVLDLPNSCVCARARVCPWLSTADGKPPRPERAKVRMHVQLLPKMVYPDNGIFYWRQRLRLIFFYFFFSTMAKINFSILYIGIYISSKWNVLSVY